MTAPEPRESSFIDGTDLVDSLLDEPGEDVRIGSADVSRSPRSETDTSAAEALTDDELNELAYLIASVRDQAPRLPNDADSGDVLAAIEPVVGRIITGRVRAAAESAWDECNASWGVRGLTPDDANPYRVDRRAER